MIVFFLSGRYLRSVLGWSLSNKLWVNFTSLEVCKIIFPRESYKQWNSSCSSTRADAWIYSVFGCVYLIPCTFVWVSGCRLCKLIVSELIRYIEGLIVLSMLRTSSCFFLFLVWNCNLCYLLFHYVCTLLRVLIMHGVK